MAINISTMDAAEMKSLRLPHPPPLLHTRAGNEAFDCPSTPTSNVFTSPAQTPQGSPSKNKMPPGAVNLSNIFDKSLKLAPSSPTRSGHGSPRSPGKGGLAIFEDFNESVIHKDTYQSPGSPTRRSNKENASPSAPRLAKELTLNVNAAAISRHELYQSREPESPRKAQSQLRGLTTEELEKLQQPKVKRLTNVTQLCEIHSHAALLARWTDRVPCRFLRLLF